MIAAATHIGIGVSRDWLDGFYLPCGHRFRFPNSMEGHISLLGLNQHTLDAIKIGFEATTMNFQASAQGYVSEPPLWTMAVQSLLPLGPLPSRRVSP
jgi:hypothetical protein